MTLKSIRYAATSRLAVLAVPGVLLMLWPSSASAQLPPGVPRMPLPPPPPGERPLVSLDEEPDRESRVGRVVEVGDNSLTVEQAAQDGAGKVEQTYQVAPGARVRLNQNLVDLQALQPGDGVRVVVLESRPLVAQSIWAARVRSQVPGAGPEDDEEDIARRRTRRYRPAERGRREVERDEAPDRTRRRADRRYLQDGQDFGGAGGVQPGVSGRTAWGTPGVPLLGLELGRSDGNQVAPGGQQPADQQQQVDGVPVRNVRSGSLGARLGLQPGDVIIGVGGRPVSTPEEIAQRLQQVQRGSPVDIQVQRSGRQLTFRLDPEDVQRVLSQFRQRGGFQQDGDLRNGLTGRRRTRLDDEEFLARTLAQLSRQHQVIHQRLQRLVVQLQQISGRQGVPGPGAAQQRRQRLFRPQQRDSDVLVGTAQGAGDLRQRLQVLVRQHRGILQLVQQIEQRLAVALPGGRVPSGTGPGLQGGQPGAAGFPADGGFLQTPSGQQQPQREFEQFTVPQRQQEGQFRRQQRQQQQESRQGQGVGGFGESPVEGARQNPLRGFQ